MSFENRYISPNEMHVEVIFKYLPLSHLVSIMLGHRWHWTYHYEKQKKVKY